MVHSFFAVLARKLDGHAARNDPVLVSLIEEPLHGKPAAIAVIQRELIDVHPDKSIRLGAIEPTSVLHGVSQRLAPVVAQGAANGEVALDDEAQGGVEITVDHEVAGMPVPRAPEGVRELGHVVPIPGEQREQACAFAARRGLVSEEQLEAMGADPYAVLFELERRGILAEFARAIQVPPQGGR